MLQRLFGVAGQGQASGLSELHAGRIEVVHPMLPVMRDPDGFIYYKEEVGGLLMGGFEPVAKPWLEKIPELKTWPSAAALMALTP